MAGRLQDAIQRGLRASQPAATTVASGTFYFVTDEGVTERASDSTTGLGVTWESVTDGVISGSSSQISPFLLMGG